MTWTNDELGGMISGLVLNAHVAGADFKGDAGGMPLHTIRRLLEYGWQQDINDKAALGREATVETKRETASLRAAALIDGTWVDGARKVKASVDLETQARRNVVLANMEKADKKRLAEKSGDEKVKILDDIFDNNEKALAEAFDEELARLTAPKKKIAVKVSF